MNIDRFPFLNRDLSWLSFNHRVLMEAGDETVPLYNRLSFLSIFSSNLDEFYRVRMPAIFAFSNITGKKISIRDEYPVDLVERVRSILELQLTEYGTILTTQILPALKQNHIILYYGDAIAKSHQEIMRDYFLSHVLSFLQPIIFRKENKEAVFLENNSLYLICDIEPTDGTGKRRTALLNIPSANLSRFHELPAIDGDFYIAFLDDVIRENLSLVFPGFTVLSAYSVKLTRDAEMNLEDEFTGDIAEKIEKQLEKRDIGRSTRFLYDAALPAETKNYLQDYFGFREEEMVAGGRYHNLKDLGSLPNPTKQRLAYEKWAPLQHPGFSNERSIFQSIADGDKLLHLPYHSYNYILRFFNEAAIDPHVKEIFVTLYRVASDSHIVNALISAAKNGKKVTVFVELKARFDEANNLRWSKKMKAAGIKIINSIPGLKVHSKIALIHRSDQQQWKSFSLMATGNFNESTGRFYTDHVLFTARPEFGTELEWLFEYLQSRTPPADYLKIPFKHLLVSQFNLIKRFGELIDREIAFAKNGRPARIIIKLNNLQERDMIAKLYEAAEAGVTVELIVRSICCLAPDFNKNITVRRIVDRYLEHGRLFVFHNDGQPEYFMGSADWMNRNLHRRIEVCFPIYDQQCCNEIKEILRLQLNDTKKAVQLNDQLENVRINDSLQYSELTAQEAIYNFVRETSV